MKPVMDTIDFDVEQTSHTSNIERRVGAILPKIKIKQDWNIVLRI